MKKLFLWLVSLAMLPLVACNTGTPATALGVSGQPTLVFVYTEN